jgi:hypothetical protein
MGDLQSPVGAQGESMYVREKGKVLRRSDHRLTAPGTRL